MKKIKILYIILFISVLFSCGISVYATSYLYNSDEVSYSNTSTGITSDNVQGAIDTLYTLASNYSTLNNEITTLETYNVVETGTSSPGTAQSGVTSNWYWRKYPSGTLDMWTYYTSTSNSKYSTYNNLPAHVITLYFPTNVKPINGSYTISASWNIGSMAAITAGYGDHTTTKFTLYGLATTTSSTVYARIYVHGKWK